MKSETKSPSQSGAAGTGRKGNGPAGAGPQEPEAEDLSLPHERDETPAGGAKDAVAPGGPRAVIDQAARDIRRGLVDTEGRGVPTDVPGPGRSPERSDGAAVPREGVDKARHRRPGKEE